MKSTEFKKNVKEWLSLKSRPIRGKWSIAERADGCVIVSVSINCRIGKESLPIKIDSSACLDNYAEIKGSVLSLDDKLNDIIQQILKLCAGE